MSDLGKQICRCIVGACDDTCKYYDAEKACCVGYEEVTEQAEKVFAEYENYKNLDEQGKLMKLPCAVGDDVWYILERVENQGRKKVEISFVDHGTVDNITLGHMMIPQITVCNDENAWTTFDGVEDFGKTVFLTQESAESALKEL